MKICVVWPFKSPIFGESLEFYNALKNKADIILTDNFDEADYLFYMMDIRNCMNLPWYNRNDMKEEVLEKIKNSKSYSKEVIIDYNDFTDTRGVPEEALPLIKKYFKRSVVDKKNMTIISYNREIIPISYAIRSDFIEYDKYFNSNFSSPQYLYDVCCLFDKNANNMNTNRGKIPYIVEQYTGSKYIGLAATSNYGNRYFSVNENYYGILKKSKIIVTANPPNWEGDFRLWEALLVGNLVMCDKMVLPHILKYPLINKKHIVFYDNPNELLQLINYYILNENERNEIGNEGRKYCLENHTFSNRLDEILEELV
jgi:spore maturation protein CgeB